MWACAAITNLIQNDPATRRLLQGKNIVGALIARLTDSVEDVVVESCGALRYVVPGHRAGARQLAEPPLSGSRASADQSSLTSQESLHRRRVRLVRRDLQQGHPVAPRCSDPAGTLEIRDATRASVSSSYSRAYSAFPLQITSTLNGIFTAAPLDLKKDLVEIRKRKLVYDLSENVLTILWCLSYVPPSHTLLKSAENSTDQLVLRDSTGRRRTRRCRLSTT